MNFLLEQKYRYIVFESLNNVRGKLKAITKTPWYDIAINLAGKVSDDNTFELYSKLSLGVNVFNVPQNIAIIMGRLKSETEEQTDIHVVVRPNYAVLFVFYFVIAIFLFKLFTAFHSNVQDWILNGFLFLFLVFLRSIIYFSMGQLKNRFERIMSVEPEE
jgi:hypothetical protein